MDMDGGGPSRWQEHVAPIDDEPEAQAPSADLDPNPVDSFRVEKPTSKSVKFPIFSAAVVDGR